MRIATGIIAILFLVIGASLYINEAQVNPMVPGSMVRIGSLMAVIWLAFPQLEKSKDRIPRVVLGIAVACLFLIAARPKISHVVIAVGGLAIALSTVLRFFSSLTDGK